MKRILLKLSGEALAGAAKRGFDEETVIAVAKQIRTISEEGTQVGIVIGGGNFWRGRTSETINRNKADQIGTQTLSGELQKKKGVKIPDQFKTVTINVIVEESEVNPPQPEDKVVIAVEKLADLTVKFGTPAENMPIGFIRGKKGST